MLMQKDLSRLVLVDIQEKLVPLVHEPQQLIDSCVWLARLANQLSVPMMVSEHYPKGLGRTVEPLRDLVAPSLVADKVHFSCVAARCFDWLPGADRRQVVVAGIEAHVCVLQTAMELKQTGNEVFLVADAVSSRNSRDIELAIERMRHAGIQIVSREMVLFEWAHKAGTQQFKDLSQQFLK